MGDRIERLRICIKKKGEVLKKVKEKHDHEVSMREEVEQRQKEELVKYENDLKVIRDRNLSVLKDSKKKKKTIKELEKEEKKH